MDASGASARSTSSADGCAAGERRRHIETRDTGIIYTAAVIFPSTIVDWSGFLARPGMAPPTRSMLEGLRKAPILVLGAGGSIGSALALRVAALEPPKLVLLEASESHLDALQRQWAQA